MHWSLFSLVFNENWKKHQQPLLERRQKHFFFLRRFLMWEKLFLHCLKAFWNFTKFVSRFANFTLQFALRKNDMSVVKQKERIGGFLVSRVSFSRMLETEPHRQMVYQDCIFISNNNLRGCYTFDECKNETWRTSHQICSHWRCLFALSWISRFIWGKKNHFLEM